jgi:hypothetical protein
VVVLPALETLGVPLSPSWYVVVASMFAATIGAAVYR